MTQATVTQTKPAPTKLADAKLRHPAAKPQHQKAFKKPAPKRTPPMPATADHLQKLVAKFAK